MVLGRTAGAGVGGGGVRGYLAHTKHPTLYAGIRSDLFGDQNIPARLLYTLNQQNLKLEPETRNTTPETLYQKPETLDPKL